MTKRMCNNQETQTKELAKEQTIVSDLLTEDLIQKIMTDLSLID